MHAPPRFDPRFVLRLLDACEELPRPVVLVLDDLHQLAGTPAMGSLAEATRRGLGNLHLVIATRMDPPLPLQRLRLSDELTEIRGEDLAFNAPECVQLLGHYDLVLRPEQLHTLLHRTEGWATGLRLAALALLASHDVDRAVAELAGDHRNVADFFVEEVLDHLPTDVVDFLLDTCVPRRICAGLATTLTGRRDAQAVLTELERDNLFVVALDGRRAWYRYHHLFGDLLRHRLVANNPDRVRELHLVCASWFAEHDDHLETAWHLAEAAAWGDLARYTTRCAAANLLGVERHALVQLLHRMPGWLVLRDPDAATAAAIAAYGEYDLQALRGHVAEARGMQHVLGGLDAQVVDAVLTTLEALAAWMDGDAELQAETATAALDRLGRLTTAALPALPAYRGKLNIVLGIGRMWSGHLDEADEVLTHTERSFAAQDGVPPVLSVHLHSNLAVLRAFQGRLREAQREADIALSVAERSGWLFLAQSGMALLAEAVIAMVRGEYERCAEVVERARASLLDLQDPFALAALVLVQARVELATGKVAAAAATLAQLRTGPHSWRLPWFLQRWSELVELEIALAAGDADRRDALQEHLENSWDSARPEAHRISLVARAHVAANRPEQALAVLECITQSAPRDLIPTVDGWVVCALAHDRLRQDADALEALERALDLAEDEGIVRPFLLSGHRLAVLLERQQQVHNDHQAFVQRLLSRFGSEANHTVVPALPLVEPLTNRERSVLQLLPTMMSNSEIADQLSVSVNTVKVHLKSLYRKLGVKTRRQAVVRARALGLIEAGSVVVPA
jgi:LuxR family maltose regulon positive regulatory protein